MIKNICPLCKVALFSVHTFEMSAMSIKKNRGLQYENFFRVQEILSENKHKNNKRGKKIAKEDKEINTPLQTIL